MKCMICNTDFIEDNVYFLFKVRYICNKCSNLFIYMLKNVRINKAKIMIYYFKYYDNIVYFDDDLVFQAYNDYLMKHIIKAKLYDIKLFNKAYISSKKRYFYFKRKNFKELIRIIKTNKEIVKYGSKIYLYEIL